MKPSFNINQFSKQSPAWVVALLVGITFICQGLPPVISGYGIVGPKSKEAISMTCDIINLVAAGLAPFFGTKAQEVSNENS